VFSVPIPSRGNRALRSRAGSSSGGVVSPSKGVASPIAADKSEGTPSESVPAWGVDFDPISFVSEHLKGDTKRFDTMPLKGVRKVAVGNGLRCVALNELVYGRLEKGKWR
jgi:hypothetical protein